MISSENPESWERTAIRVSLGVSCQSSSRGTEQKPDFVWWVCSLFLTEMSLRNHKVYSHPPKTTTGGALASYSLWLEQWQGHCRLFCGVFFFMFKFHELWLWPKDFFSGHEKRWSHAEHREQKQKCVLRSWLVYYSALSPSNPLLMCCDCSARLSWELTSLTVLEDGNISLRPRRHKPKIQQATP